MVNRLNMQAFGVRIADARHRIGLTQQALADKTGLQQSWIARMERGKQVSVRGDTIVGLANGLGVSADYLLGMTGESACDSRQSRTPGMHQIPDIGVDAP